MSFKQKQRYDCGSRSTSFRKEGFTSILIYHHPFEVVRIKTTNQPLAPNLLNVGHDGIVPTFTGALEMALLSHLGWFTEQTGCWDSKHGQLTFQNVEVSDTAELIVRSVLFYRLGKSCSNSRF